MKKFIVFFVLPLFFMSAVQSQQYLGGEIWWDCLSNGRFTFRLNLYKSCGGVDFKDSILLHSNSPAGDMILHIYPDNISGITDLTPVCNPDTTLPHLHCDSIGMPGAVLMAYYTTDQAYPAGVLINGVPPPAGYRFYIDECCRDSTSNIDSVGLLYLEAKMFNYYNQNTYPCFDNAPKRKVPGLFSLCSDLQGDFYNLDWDKEMDIIYYNWAPALTDSGQSCNYKSGFSYQHPFGSLVSLDTNSGKIIFDSLSCGKYTNVIKMTVYKCGKKVAEINKELITSVLPCERNNPPLIPPPFINPSTGLYTEYIDTVYPGELVNFPLNVFDYDTFTSGTPQTITLEAFSEQFGDNYSSISLGCLNPPCATLTNPPPLIGQINITDTLLWQVVCSHLCVPCPCFQTTSLFKYHFKGQDNFCPIPSSNMVQLTLVVLDWPVNYLITQVNCISSDAAGNVILKTDTAYDPFNNLDIRRIYVAHQISGPYYKLDSIMDPNQKVFIDTVMNAGIQPLYYYVESESKCWNIAHSDTLSPIFLQLSHTPNYDIQLNWNANHLQANPQWYRIYRKQNPGSWILLDTTQMLSYIDTSYHLPDTLFYRIETGDSSGCLSSSAIFSTFPQYAGIDEMNWQAKRSFVVYPNPASDQIAFEYFIPTGGNIQFMITDMLGKEIEAFTIISDPGKKHLKLDVKDYPQGMYLLVMKYKNDKAVKKFFIIK
ncbi:T9SS type A sorting domain-containing protein [Bacteroidota bacterium]